MFSWRSEMTKRVAWFTGQASSGSVTPYKVYEVFNEDSTSFNLKDDAGDTRFCSKRGCAHICHKDWVIADVVDEEKVETLKRIGVVDLLPEDSEFTLGQEVIVVDSALYSGKAILRGCEYNRDGSFDGYIVETPEKHGSPDDGGLCKGGFALWVRDKGIKAIVEQTKPKKAKKWSKWYKNTTGKCPEDLKRKQKIKLKWSDGDKFNISKPHDAAWYFSQGDNPVDITHYKVKLKDISDDAPTSASKAKQNTDWQDNVLGLCPVPPHKTVEARLKCGEILKWAADSLNWGETLTAGRKIVKWRLAD